MWVHLDRFSRVLADATMAETVFLSLVVLLMLFCQQPARRIVLAKTAILLSTLMIPLVAYSPLPHLHLRYWFAGRDAPPATADGDRARASELLVVTPESPAGKGPPDPAMARDSASWTTYRPGRILTLLYLAGVSIGLVWFLMGFWVLARLTGRSDEPSASVLALYRDVAREYAGGSSVPRLRVSSRVHQPVLAGAIYPNILIPSAYVTGPVDRESLRIILIHELAHAGQGDSRFSAGATLAQSLWFFLPFLWWLRVQLRTDQEFLADRRTAEIAGSPTGYAARLVNLAAPADERTFRRPIMNSVSMISGHWRAGGFKSQLLQRVVMLLHCPFPVEIHAPRWWSLSVPLLVLALAVLCSIPTLTESGEWRAVAASAAPGSGTENRFQIAQFVASPQVLTRSGRSTPYVLPLPLPERWDLSVEILASPSALNRIRIAGLLLSSPHQSPDGESRLADSSPSWHQVHLHRDGSRITVEIDGQPIPRGSGSVPPADWLSIEPAPDETARLRSLIVTW